VQLFNYVFNLVFLALREVYYLLRIAQEHRAFRLSLANVHGA
jgi:hypothetical protein